MWVVKYQQNMPKLNIVARRSYGCLLKPYPKVICEPWKSTSLRLWNQCCEKRRGSGNRPVKLIIKTDKKWGKRYHLYYLYYVYAWWVCIHNLFRHAMHCGLAKHVCHWLNRMVPLKLVISRHIRNVQSTPLMFHFQVALSNRHIKI